MNKILNRKINTKDSQKLMELFQILNAAKLFSKTPKNLIVFEKRSISGTNGSSWNPVNRNSNVAGDIFGGGRISLYTVNQLINGSSSYLS